MVTLMCLFIGFSCAVMVVFNGELSTAFGAYLSTVLIHLTGLAAVGLIQCFRRQSLRPARRLPPWFFLGGAVGVATTMFSNMAFGVISVSAILALGLLGQSVTSVAIDGLGLFGMEKRPFNKRKLLGTGFVILGIVLMLVL